MANSFPLGAAVITVGAHENPSFKQTVGGAKTQLKGLGDSVKKAGAGVDQFNKKSSRTRERMIELSRGLEDATIGFGVNGFTGAVRGATNNLSRFFELTGGKVAIIGTVAATAVAALVGPLERWLKSTNSIGDAEERLNKKLERQARLLDMIKERRGRQDTALQEAREFRRFLRTNEELARQGDVEALQKRLEDVRARRPSLRLADIVKGDEFVDSFRDVFRQVSSRDIARFALPETKNGDVLVTETRRRLGLGTTRASELTRGTRERVRDSIESDLRTGRISIEKFIDFLKKSKNLEKLGESLDQALKDARKAANALRVNSVNQELELKKALRSAIAGRSIVSILPFLAGLGGGLGVRQPAHEETEAERRSREVFGARQRRELQRIENRRGSLVESLITGDEGRRFKVEQGFRQRQEEIGGMFAGDPRRGALERLNELRRESELNKLKKKPGGSQFIGAAGFAKSIQQSIKPRDPVQEKIQKDTSVRVKRLEEINKRLKDGITIEEIIGSAGPATAG